MTEHMTPGRSGKLHLAAAPASENGRERRLSARIFETIRTAHLERQQDMAPAQLLFHRTRYDFDPSLVPDDLPPKRIGRLHLLAHLATTPYRVVEINEPNMVDRWPDLLGQIIAIRLRSLVRKERTRVVAYCIGMTDPVAYLHDRKRLPISVARLLSSSVERSIIAGVDRLAFGTAGSRDLYAATVGEARLEAKSRTFEALPCPCRCLITGEQERARERVLFVGSFDERKGIRQMLALWDEVSQRRPQATFHIIGKGKLLRLVQSWADSRDRVTVEVDPPRTRIHEALRSSTCVVLLSQRIGSWREQVGLPIVEGLAHGCEVITTPETGLAEWLRSHGHLVLETLDEQASTRVADKIASARPPAIVLSALPGTDMRIKADQWLME